MATMVAEIPTTDFVDGVYYPSEDGKPMAETGIHVNAIIELRVFLDDLLAGRADVWIGTDQFWYWKEGRPSLRYAPDIMVVFGVPREPERRSFMTWRENGAIPSFICEFASQHTWRSDLGAKFRRFERLGVKEYFIFDPEYRYLNPAFRGFRLRSDKYQRIRPNADGSLESKTLGVRLVARGRFLRLIDPTTGRIIPSRLERVQEAERRLAELTSKDAEIARLKALLEESKRSPNGRAKS